jgi:hypothetical protein
MTLNCGLVCGKMLCAYLKLGSLKIMKERKNFSGNALYVGICVT